MVNLLHLLLNADQEVAARDKDLWRESVVRVVSLLPHAEYYSNLVQNREFTFSKSPDGKISGDLPGGGFSAKVVDGRVVEVRSDPSDLVGLPAYLDFNIWGVKLLENLNKGFIYNDSVRVLSQTVIGDRLHISAVVTGPNGVKTPYKAPQASFYKESGYLSYYADSRPSRMTFYNPYLGIVPCHPKLSFKVMEEIPDSKFLIRSELYWYPLRKLRLEAYPELDRKDNDLHVYVWMVSAYPSNNEGQLDAQFSVDGKFISEPKYWEYGSAVATSKTFFSGENRDFEDGKLCILTQSNGVSSIWLKEAAFLPIDEGIDCFLTNEAGWTIHTRLFSGNYVMIEKKYYEVFTKDYPFYGRVTQTSWFWGPLPVQIVNWRRAELPGAPAAIGKV